MVHGGGRKGRLWWQYTGDSGLYMAVVATVACTWRWRCRHRAAAVDTCGGHWKGGVHTAVAVAHMARWWPGIRWWHTMWRGGRAVARGKAVAGAGNGKFAVVRAKRWPGLYYKPTSGAVTGPKGCANGLRRGTTTPCPTRAMRRSGVLFAIRPPARRQSAFVSRRSIPRRRRHDAARLPNFRAAIAVAVHRAAAVVHAPPPPSTPRRAARLSARVRSRAAASHATPRFASSSPPAAAHRRAVGPSRSVAPALPLRGAKPPRRGLTLLEEMQQLGEVRDWAPPGWHWEVLASGSRTLVRNPGPVVDPDILWWRSYGPRSFQREPAPPEEVAQRIAAEDEHVRRYILQVVVESMERDETQENFMADLIANGTLDDRDDDVIPDDGGDDVTATFLNDSGEGAENIEEEDPNGAGEEEDHHNGSGTVVITEPSGSSTSSVKSRKRGPAKKLDDGVRHDITHIAKDGKPIAPEKGAKAFIAQCGVLVRDHVPITVREWNKPKGLVLSAEEEAQGLYIDDVAKNSILTKLMSHFNIVPEEGGAAEKAKMEHALTEFAKKKMAELFKNHKKRLRGLIKKKKTPDSEKVKNHWDEFVKYNTESEEFKKRSETNKANAALKKYHQILGPGGYRANRPKWEAAEAELTRKGIRLGTHGWIERCKEWFYGIGGTLHPETGKCIYKKAHLKFPIEALEKAHKDVEEGRFQPDRENDELTRALGNKEHGGRTRGTEGSVPWNIGFPAERKRFPDKSHERRKARETDRIATLEEGFTTMQAQLTMVTQVLTSQMAQGQAVDPAPLLDALVPLQSQQHRRSSVASSQQADHINDEVVEPPRYPPVDDLTESRPCELHVKVFNLSFKAAVGIFLPTRSYHCRPVQDDFAVVMVDEVLRDYEGMVLEHPAGEDGEIKELGEARRTTVQWRKENIVFPGEKPPSRPPPPPPPPPAGSPPRDESPPRDDSPMRDDDSPVHEQSPPRENTPPPPPPRQETPPPPPKQKRKLTAAPPTAPKRSSTPMRAQTPELLPHEQTEEQKAFLAPKKMFIKPQTMKHFAETRMKRPELRSDHDRSLGQSYRASKEAKKVAQLGQQDNQAIPHFVVQPYDDPETASMIEREARAQGASVDYEDYYPTAQVVNKYRYGKDLVKPGELARLGTQMRRLHDWYLKACRRGDRYLTVYLRDEHYFRGNEEINLELEELFQLFNQDALDKAVISCYCLMKKLECKRGKLLPLGFMDPDTVHEVTVRDFAKDTEDNMVMFLVKQANKEEIFFPYNFKFHFILLIIDLHKGVVKVMDSKRKEYAEWADMAVILQRAWKRFITTVPGKWKPELTFEDYPERGNNLCGYYVCTFIRDMACPKGGDARYTRST
ncbi:hypothetical protein QYE76_058611 [Lolium multiflorum]|uniref:DUF8039 domain-containing protein n=1 Tax=Lolium multiflorum TaxID=4521 RepID=A0AAD8T5H0_LOLMU|nr:hypothetical protein QYE76_058611 [Lolium multiflorum]